MCLFISSYMMIKLSSSLVQFVFKFTTFHLVPQSEESTFSSSPTSNLRPLTSDLSITAFVLLLVGRQVVSVRRPPEGGATRFEMINCLCHLRPSPTSSSFIMFSLELNALVSANLSRMRRLWFVENP